MMHGNFFARHCANGSSKIQGICFDQSYSPDDLFRINVAITAMHILTAIILDFINSSQNKNVTIHKRVCISPSFNQVNACARVVTRLVTRMYAR